MANELLTILEYIEQERGISRESLVRALESAILTASRKSIHPASELKVKIDPKINNKPSTLRRKISLSPRFVYIFVRENIHLNLFSFSLERR